MKNDNGPSGQEIRLDVTIEAVSLRALGKAVAARGKEKTMSHITQYSPSFGKGS